MKSLYALNATAIRATITVLALSLALLPKIAAACGNNSNSTCVSAPQPLRFMLQSQQGDGQGSQSTISLYNNGQCSVGWIRSGDGETSSGFSNAGGDDCRLMRQAANRVHAGQTCCPISQTLSSYSADGVTNSSTYVQTSDCLCYISSAFSGDGESNLNNRLVPCR